MDSGCRIRRARCVLASIVLVFGLWVVGSPDAHAYTCQEAINYSGVAWTGSSAIIVASPELWNGGDLDYFWQEADTGKWHKQVVATGNPCPLYTNGQPENVPTGYSSSAIAWTGDSVVIAAVDERNGGIYYWWQPKGSGTWHQQTVATGPPGCCVYGGVQNGVTTPNLFGYFMPSIAWTGDSVVIAANDGHGLH
jgi:hypothetical protein